MRSKRRYVIMAALAALGLGGIAGSVAAAAPAGLRPLTPSMPPSTASTSTARTAIVGGLPPRSIEAVGDSAPTSPTVPPAGTEVKLMAEPARGEVHATSARPAVAPEKPSRAQGTIAFVRDNAIHTVNPDGTGLSRLAPEGAFDQDPAWSPSHDRIAFGRGANIHVMSADGSGLTQLTSAGLDKAPTWSPNGERIAFSRQGGTAVGIWVMNADGTGQRPLVDVPGVAWRLSWSPDGGEIALSTYSSPGVWVAAADGSGLRKISETGSGPAWGPHGRVAYFAESSPYNGDIFVMNRNGNGIRSLPGGSSPAVDANPAWSADGSKIAFTSYRDGDWAIFTMSAHGTDITRITHGDTPAW